MRSVTALLCLAISAVVLGCAGPGAPTVAPPDPSQVRITVLYDAFGKQSAMQRDWGYAALVEYGGKRILFDTGNNADILAKNAKAKDVDLSRLDFVVMSHRHGDHMGGMSYLLSVNPNVKIYAPIENAGVYGGRNPGTFYRMDPTLSADERYFAGAPPEFMPLGSAWPRANIQLIDKTTDIAPGIHVVFLVSDKPGTLELRELSLAIDTPQGEVVVVGCSHAGIDNVIAAVAKINPKIHFLAGGIHLVVAKDPEIETIVALLHDRFHVDYIAPGHCTGEATFTALKKAYGDRYLYAGLGTTIVVGDRPRPLAMAPGDPTAGVTGDDLDTYRALLAGSAEFDEDVVLAGR
jgi:7,8-dihydropterin-6-yl-methyl-4-(beta-D-ribofuranosyl)aminobenzene 5'-phosphate synthase